MQKYRLCGGTVITPGGLKNTDLLIVGGRIEGLIDRAKMVSNDYQLIDCSGLYISPGFVDIHQHGGGGSDYMDDDPDAYYYATKAHLERGITAVMPTLLSADPQKTLRAVSAYHNACCDSRIKTNLLGVHIEGPYISPLQAGAQKPEHIRGFDEREYRAIWEKSQGKIARWSVAPELSGCDKFAKFAREHNIALSIAHSNADLGTVQRAFDMGFDHITHLYSCMSTIVRKGGFRVPGVLEAAYLIDGMHVEIIADGCHLPMPLIQYVVKFKNKQHIALVTDAMRAAGQETDRSFLGSKDDPLAVIIEDGVAKMEDRKAFAGSIATGDRLIRAMLTAGVSLSDAVNMVTVNPLRMMKLNVKKGRISVGYDADIVAFDPKIQIQKVFVNGNQVV